MSQDDTDQKRKQENQEAVTPPVVRLAAAEVDAAAAKDRLNDTVARLQSKIDPKLIAKEAGDEAKRYGREGAAFARDNQQAFLGLAGGVLLYLLRKPLLGVFKRRKYPKPQRAAKPMTATEPNKRLAARAHPTATPVTPGSQAASKVALAAAHPTMTAAQTSNEGAPLQGTAS